VSRHLASRGAVIVDADLLARQVVEPGRPSLRKLADRFGPTIVDPSTGALNRAALREVISRDADARRFVNSVVHPAVAMEMVRLVAVHRWIRGETVVIDSPLLFESGNVLRWLCCPILVVTTPEAAQLGMV